MSEEEGGQRKAIEFHPPLLIIRTKRGLNLLDRISRYDIVYWVGWLFVVMMPLITLMGLYVITRSVNILVTNIFAREFVRSITPLANLLIPGLNPYLPIVYGWVALIIGIVVHEAAHGVLARSLSIQVKSTGLLLFLIVPVGAFVDVDDKEIRASKARNAGRILAAGPGSNMFVALVSLALLLAVLGSATPVVDGIGVTAVAEGYPAHAAGLLPGDVITKVNGVSIAGWDYVYTAFSRLKPGDSVELSVVRLVDGVIIGSYDLGLTAAVNPYNSSRGYLGLAGVGLRDALDNYRGAWLSNPFIYLVWPTFSAANQELIPFSDLMVRFYTSPLGALMPILANLFFWVWFVNFNLSIFNALPIYPLDGGHAFRVILQGALRNVVSERVVARLTMGVTLIVLGLVLSMLVFPYIPLP